METLQIRLHKSLLQRAEALVPKFAALPEAAAVGRMSRAAVIRRALAEGLAVLESRLGGGAGDTPDRQPPDRASG